MLKNALEVNTSCRGLTCCMTVATDIEWSMQDSAGFPDEHPTSCQEEALRGIYMLRTCLAIWKLEFGSVDQSLPKFWSPRKTSPAPGELSMHVALPKRCKNAPCTAFSSKKAAVLDGKSFIRHFSHWAVISNRTEVDSAHICGDRRHPASTVLCPPTPIGTANLIYI